MSTRRCRLRLGTSLGLCVLLAACAVEPSKPPPKPAEVIPRPGPPSTRVASLARTRKQSAWWGDLAASFVLHDCADSPLIRAKEAMYTRYPRNFERLLKQSLPLMQYVDKQLRRADIPGEFVMLPMLESSYEAMATGIHGAAGMWQLMRHTAHLKGVVMNRSYRGRRDPVASTKAAIMMLKSLHKRFGDWRLVDMAYNAGPYTIVRALRKHPGIGHAAIPDLPVSRTTRSHIAELMALSCIVRKPAHFHVKLPWPKPADEFRVVQVPAGTRLAGAADMAGISEKKLRAFNPGYRGAIIPARSPHKLLLPRAAAESLAAALTVKSSQTVAQNDPPGTGTDPAGDPPSSTAASAPRDRREHRVRKGESLWSIAHRYHVSIRSLKHWNHLDSDILHPGEELFISN